MILAPDGTAEILAHRRTLASANARCQHKDAQRNTYGCNHATRQRYVLACCGEEPWWHADHVRRDEMIDGDGNIFLVLILKQSGNVLEKKTQNVLVLNQNARHWEPCKHQHPKLTLTMLFSVGWNPEPSWTFPNFLPSFKLTNHFSVSDGSWLTTLSLSVSPPFLSLMPACLHSLASASAEWMALCQPHTTAELIRHSASGPSPCSLSLYLTRARSLVLSLYFSCFYFASVFPLPFNEHT